MTEIVVKAPKISPEEYEKYRGKTVTIHKGKIIAEGNKSTKHCKTLGLNDFLSGIFQEVFIRDINVVLIDNYEGLNREH